jgi:peptidyl-tRNA hydrolase
MGVESAVESAIKTAMQTALTAAQIAHPAFRCFWLNDTTDEKPEAKELPAIAIVAGPYVPTGAQSTFKQIAVEITAMSELHDDPKRATLVALWTAAIAPIYAGSLTVSGYGLNGVLVEDGDSTIDAFVNALTVRVSVRVCG